MATDPTTQAAKSQALREDNVQRSITNITEAVSAIVSHSTDEDFRQTCFSLMEVSDSAGLATHLSSQLQALAHKDTGVAGRTSAAKGESFQPATVTTPHMGVATPSQNSDPTLDPGQPRSTDDATVNDDFSEFSDVDFFDEEAVSETFHPESPIEGAVQGGEPSTEASKSLKVFQSPTEDDWFDKVLDSELFVNEK